MLPEHIGKWRNYPVWIGRTRAEAFSEGPTHTLIDPLMDDLIAFSDRFDLNPIVQAALVLCLLNGVITVAMAQRYANVTQPPALKAIKTLETEGVLRRARSTKSKAHVWIVKDLVEFFEQAQRNSRPPLSESSY